MAAERTPEFFAGKNVKVGIIGCGYVGLPLALRFADDRPARDGIRSR